MVVNFKLPKWLLAVAMGAALSACGGGGGGGGGGGSVTGDQPGTQPDVDAEATVAMIATALQDAVRGVPNMVGLAGTARLLGGDVLQQATSCTGGGSITTRKTGNQFTLAASGCKPSLSEPLVYNGSWTLQVVSTNFDATGACATASCTFVASITHPANGFGYGVTDMPTLGDRIEVRYDGSYTSYVHTAAASLPVDGSTTLVVSSGEVANAGVSQDRQFINASVAGQPFLASKMPVGSSGRSYLSLSVPFEGVVFYADAVYLRKNGVPDRKIPWSEFLE